MNLCKKVYAKPIQSQRAKAVAKSSNGTVNRQRRQETAGGWFQCLPICFKWSKAPRDPQSLCIASWLHKLNPSNTSSVPSRSWRRERVEVNLTHTSPTLHPHFPSLGGTWQSGPGDYGSRSLAKTLKTCGWDDFPWFPNWKDQGKDCLCHYDPPGLSIWINLTHIGGCSKCIPVAAAKESRSNALAPGWTWTGKVASNWYGWYGITPAKSVYFPRTSQTRRSRIIFRLLSCDFMRFVHPQESSVPLDLHCMVRKRLLCDPATHRSGTSAHLRFTSSYVMIHMSHMIPWTTKHRDESSSMYIPIMPWHFDVFQTNNHHVRSIFKRLTLTTDQSQRSDCSRHDPDNDRTVKNNRMAGFTGFKLSFHPGLRLAFLPVSGNSGPLSNLQQWHHVVLGRRQPRTKVRVFGEACSVRVEALDICAFNLERAALYVGHEGEVLK